MHRRAVMQRHAEPSPALSVSDAVFVVVGVVVGAGIFRTPSIVAAAAGSEALALLAWVLGGVVSLLGALCYAELATSYPNAGGDFHFLRRAYGGGLAFLFAWARLWVVQTGSITMQAFLIGDYAAAVVPLGAMGSSLYAALVIVSATLVNMWRLRRAASVQRALTGLTLVALFAVIIAGLVAPAPPPASAPTLSPSFGLAMVFVLLTYGGWNEAAYLSAEVRPQKSAILRTLLISLGIITVFYLLANLAYLHGLGFAGTVKTRAVGADLMTRVLGRPGALLITLIIAVAAFSTVNATVLTGARSVYALGRDNGGFLRLGVWHKDARVPRNALLVQATVALLLVVFATFTRDGFTTMVEYTAPVFWLFFVFTIAAIFVLRRLDPGRARPFRVAGWVPVLVGLVGVAMLVSSLVYTGAGALVGVAVLATGVPFYFATRASRRRASHVGTHPSPHPGSAHDAPRPD